VSAIVGRCGLHSARDRRTHRATQDPRPGRSTACHSMRLYRLLVSLCRGCARAD